MAASSVRAGEVAQIAYPKSEKVSGHEVRRLLTCPVLLGYGVMVALQILALSVRVRILLPQQIIRYVDGGG